MTARLVIILALLVSIPPSRADSTTEYLAALRAAEAKTAAKEWPAAAKHWAKVVESNPVNGEYWEQLGTARYSAGDYRDAIPAFEKALDLRAGFPFNQAYNIACCHALLGDRESAIRWLRRSMALGWRNLSHARNDADLISLREDPRFKELFAVTDTSKMSRDEGWRYDLMLLTRELSRLHYGLRQGIHATELYVESGKLNDAIPSLNDSQIRLGFIRLTRIADDGHTEIWPAETRTVPLQFFYFPEGVFVTAAAPEHRELVGRQVVAVGAHPISEVLEKIKPLVGRDNDMGILGRGPQLLRMTELLHGLGFTASPGRATMTFKAEDGRSKEVELEGTTARPSASWHTLSKALNTEPLYLKNRTAPYWFEYLPDQKALFWQYNAVHSDPKEPVEQFSKRVFKFVEENPVEKLVLDLRWNGGGNTFLNTPIIQGLIKCEKINQTGKLFVIVGRNTFSAAQNAATFIERSTKAIFVGEPSGSSPNFVGETVGFTLPYSKMQGSISDLYWQSSWPMDYRTWIAPKIYAPPTFEAYKAGRDPALEAILAYESDTGQLKVR